MLSLQQPVNVVVRVSLLQGGGVEGWRVEGGGGRGGGRGGGGRGRGRGEGKPSLVLKDRQDIWRKVYSAANTMVVSL